MPDQRHTPHDEALSRWRREVRRAIPGADPDLIEEVAQHVTDRWLRARDEGLDRAAADQHAEQELDAWHDVRGRPGRVPWRPAGFWNGWISDARYAWRSLRVRPFVAVGAILLAAIATTSILAAFVITYGVLWRQLPYPHADRLAVIWQVRAGEQGQISYPDCKDLTGASVFDAAFAMSGGRGSLRVGDSIERVNLLDIEAAGFAMLGATPILGRVLHDSDAGQPSVMISHRLWRTHLSSDPNVIGRVLWLSGRNYTVVGVFPPGFDFELPITSTLKLERHDLWSVMDRSGPFTNRRDVSTYGTLVRLNPSTTLPEAQAALDAIGQRLAASQPSTNRDRTFRIVPLDQAIVSGARRPLLLACAAAVLALLIALANLMTLALLRLSQREVELAIRQALGAGGFRLRRQLFTEYALLAAVGTGVGYAAAVVVVRQLAASEALHLPRPDAIRFDAPAMILAVALAILLATALTVLPLRLRRAIGVLRAGSRVAGRSARRTRELTVGAQLALAVALSTSAVLFGLSLFRLLALDPGFGTDRVVAVRVSAYAARYPTSDHVQAFFGSIVQSLYGLPAVSHAGAGSSLPLSGQTTGTSVQAEGPPLLPGSRPSAGWQLVTPGYFSAVGMTLRRGRDFTDADKTHAQHVTVINEALAHTLFGNTDPIGKRIAVGGGDATGDWHEVIGVVADVRHHALDEAPGPRVYDLFAGHWGRTLFVVARSQTPQADLLIPMIRRAVHALDPEAPVFESATASALVARSAAPRRLAAALAIALAAAGALLALIGVYAASAAAVAERTREIGVRAALGATPGELLQLVLREAALTALGGAAFGVLGSLVAARLLNAQLFGVQVSDSLITIPVVASMLFLVAIAASFPAARRAAQTDPLIAMRLD